MEQMTRSELTLPRFVTRTLSEESRLVNLLVVVAASLFIALSAQVAIPLGAVPMTMQPLAVLLVGASLGTRRGIAATVLYLLEGAAGLPVFAHGTGTVAVLFGPTAGFLFAFPLAAAISARLAEKGMMKTFATTALSMTFALAVLHLFGWSWLAGPFGLGATKAFMVGNAPFFAGDLLKIVMAALMLPSLEKLVARTEE